MLLGTITAVGGGAVRDIVLRRIPGVLGGNTLYPTCAVVGSGVLVVLSRNGHPTLGPSPRRSPAPHCVCSPGGVAGCC
ncbi:MAG: TRIC cation channel family protein [Jatrophihabitans sp.]